MTKEQFLEEIKKEAEGYFERGEFYCSEAVAQTINNLLGKPYEDQVIKLASGFPMGMGQAGCLCGAVSGGQMGLGMAYGRTHGEAMNEKMFPLSAGLHDFVREEYGSTCCRVITRQWQGDDFKNPERKKHCIEITGKVAQWVAEKLIQGGQIQIEE